MARIRTVKPEFFEDEKLASLPAHDRLLFIGMWLLADKNGILEDRPTWIKAKVFPYENGAAVDVAQMLTRLVSGRYLIRYTVDGRNLIAVRNFTKHQRITGKEGLSDGVYPLPPSDLEIETQRGHNGDTPVTHLDAQEGKGKERKGREQGNENVADAPRPPKKKIMTVLDNPPTVEQVQAFMDQPTNDGQDWNDGILTASKYIDANLERGWLMKNGKPVASWEAQYRNWHRMAIERGDKPSRTVRNNEDAMRSLMENQVLDLGKKRSA